MKKVDYSDKNSDAVAGLVKLWLRSLKEPLISSSVWENLKKISFDEQNGFFFFFFIFFFNSKVQMKLYI